MKNKIVIILLAVTVSFGNAFAQAPKVMVSDKAGWHKIGSKNVEMKGDRDEMSIVGADRFASIQIKVKDADINLKSMEVYYDKGEKQIIPVGYPIKANGESKVFDLKGSESDLKKIVFIYNTKPNASNEKAVVEVWGLKTNSNPNKAVVSSPAVMMSDKIGWHKIGERNVDLANDRDEIAVMGADRFKSIKFVVTEASIDLLDLEIYYESGDKQDIQVRTPIMAGNESREILISGGERSLKKIVFVYKTLSNQDKVKAHVEVYGLKTNVE